MRQGFARSIMCVIGLMAINGCVSTPAEDGSENAMEPVQLTIVNETDSDMRCVVMLAHFVTRDVDTLAPGASEVLALERDRAGRALAYGYHDAEPMMVENLLCGAAGNWASSRADLALTAIQSGDAARYDAVCVQSDGISCAVTEAPAIN